jgi:hypothetical protein
MGLGNERRETRCGEQTQKDLKKIKNNCQIFWNFSLY